ncbi:4'-phosphopantetheinyl transferase superfamily [Mycena belliarum]|uniref:4'-phosphopantetheinyl transferase superfamily n=1 Tax=Mycena belliarum TaxID=1033014 RepID=A0AAD6UA41_9AGAR|nr:4'-phosphopantetheinyl transferase superfamily [Mycena belliae]
MSILGIGVDVVYVPRIAALLKRYPHRLASRILSPQEAAQSHLLADPTFIAVRWAVKEAAYKALYPHLRPTWKDLTYRGLDNGHKPVLLYYPKDNGNLGEIHVSVSHDGDYVFASVLVQAAHHRQ